MTSPVDPRRLLRAMFDAAIAAAQPDLDDSVVTGPTLTNVNGLHLLAAGISHPTAPVEFDTQVAGRAGAARSAIDRRGRQPFNWARRAASSRLPMWRSEAIAFSAPALGLDFPASHA